MLSRNLAILIIALFTVQSCLAFMPSDSNKLTVLRSGGSALGMIALQRRKAQVFFSGPVNRSYDVKESSHVSRLTALRVAGMSNDDISLLSPPSSVALPKSPPRPEPKQIYAQLCLVSIGSILSTLISPQRVLTRPLNPTLDKAILSFITFHIYTHIHVNCGVPFPRWVNSSGEGVAISALLDATNFALLGFIKGFSLAKLMVLPHLYFTVVAKFFPAHYKALHDKDNLVLHSKDDWWGIHIIKKVCTHAEVWIMIFGVSRCFHGKLQNILPSISAGFMAYWTVWNPVRARAQRK